MNQNARKYHQPVHKDLEHIVPRQTNQGKRSLQQFRNRRTLSEFTETARLDRLKREQNRRQKPKVVVLELPKKTETAPVFHSPKLTEQHKASTPFMGWINQKAVSPLLKVAAGAVILVSLGTVRPDFARAAPKPKPVPGVMEDGKKDTKAPTIFGQGKYFDRMEFDEKTGRLTVYGARLEDGTMGDVELDMREAEKAANTEHGKEYGKAFSFKGLPQGFLHSRLYKDGKYSGVGTYLIYQDVVLYLLIKPDFKFGAFPLWSPDGTSVFTHEGSIYFDNKSGSLLTTTPTTLIAFTNPTSTKGWTGTYKYENTFSGFPRLGQPTFTARETEFVDLRDPLMIFEGQRAKLQIRLASGGFKILHDDLVMGAR